ncbi:MAG: hypothetical protein Q9195_007318 [Heterodermia aff. obscurata]
MSMRNSHWRKNCEHLHLYALARNTKMKNDLEEKWGLIDFGAPIYGTSAYRGARQWGIPDYVLHKGVQGRIKSQRDKDNEIRVFENVFNPDYDIDELIRRDARLSKEDGDTIMIMGDELCTQATTMVRYDYFRRWQALVVKIRDLYLRDRTRIDENVDWDEITAWYIRSVDIALQASSLPIEDPNWSETEENSE